MYSVFSGYDTDRGCKKNGNVPGSDFQDGEKDIEEADDSQNQSYSGERAAGTTTDDEVRQYSHQRAKHEYGFWKNKQHDGNCQSAYSLRMV